MTRPTFDHASETRPLDASEVTFAFRSFGLNIGLELCEPVRPADLAASFPPGYKQIVEGPLDDVFRLTRTAGTRASDDLARYHWFERDDLRRFARTPAEAIDQAESLFERAVVELSRAYVFVHAGVVTWHGQAAIMPGTSRSGKSTLVRALIHAGATYFSDEYAVLDSNGTVYPYPRHLSQREGLFGPARRVDLAAHAPTEEEARAGAPVVLIALTKFEEGGDWHVEELTPGAAMMSISQHVIAMRSRPADAFVAMSRVVERATVVEGTRGDATAAAERILAALDAARLAPDDPDALARGPI